MRFQKRADHATTLDAKSLRDQLISVRNERVTVDEEIEGLALSSLQGNESARSAIAALHARRQNLAIDEATLLAGLRALDKLKSTPQPVDIRTHRAWPRLQRALVATIQQRYENISFHIVRNGNEHPDTLAQRLVQVEPLIVATEICEPYVSQAPRVTWSSDDSGPVMERAQKRQKELNADRTRQVTEAAQLLVNSVELPPIPEAIKRHINRPVLRSNNGGASVVGGR